MRPDPCNPKLHCRCTLQPSLALPRLLCVGAAALVGRRGLRRKLHRRPRLGTRRLARAAGADAAEVAVLHRAAEAEGGGGGRRRYREAVEKHVEDVEAPLAPRGRCHLRAGAPCEPAGRIPDSVPRRGPA
jgi:hypothetical protein